MNAEKTFAWQYPSGLKLQAENLRLGYSKEVESEQMLQIFGRTLPLPTKSR
jgi:hypothetical protein